jgi:hypothetical protein
MNMRTFQALTAAMQAQRDAFLGLSAAYFAAATPYAHEVNGLYAREGRDVAAPTTALNSEGFTGRVKTQKHVPRPGNEQ